MPDDSAPVLDGDALDGDGTETKAIPVKETTAYQLSEPPALPEPPALAEPPAAPTDGAPTDTAAFPWTASPEAQPQAAQPQYPYYAATPYPAYGPPPTYTAPVAPPKQPSGMGRVIGAAVVTGLLAGVIGGAGGYARCA